MKGCFRVLEFWGWSVFGGVYVGAGLAYSQGSVGPVVEKSGRGGEDAGSSP